MTALRFFVMFWVVFNALELIGRLWRLSMEGGGGAESFINGCFELLFIGWGLWALSD